MIVARHRVDVSFSWLGIQYDICQTKLVAVCSGAVLDRYCAGAALYIFSLAIYLPRIS